MFLVTLLLAFGPSLVWFYWLWSRDKFQREPMGLMATLLVGGGIFSVVMTLITVPMYAGMVPSEKDSVMLNMLFTAALPEELFKMLPVFIIAWRSKHWNEPFDGIVYAGASALGFHLIETTMYMFKSGSLDGTLYQGMIRGAKPGHMLYGITMGYFLSKAKFAPAGERWKYIGLALGVPVALHTAWNTASGWGGSFVGGNSIADIFFSLVAWGISVALWVTAFRYIRQGQESSPYNPKAWTLQMAPVGCHHCGGGYPQTAIYCQTCGAQVQMAPADTTAPSTFSQ